MEKVSQTQSGGLQSVDKQPRGNGEGASDISTNPELQAAGGISTQLIPEFSKKLSFVEHSDGRDVVTVQNSQTVIDKVLATHSAPSAQAGDSSSVHAASTVACASEKATAGHRESFLCPCGEEFEKSVQLAAHKRWSCKLSEKTVQCDVCKHWFASDMGLKRHAKHAHGGMFSCDSCNLRFHNKIKLTRHWLEAHLDESDGNAKNLKCYECGDTNFENKFELECHLVLHKYEKRQQKMTEKAWWSSSSHGHFAPYPSSPFAGPPPFVGRPPFPGRPPFHGRPPFPGHSPFLGRPPFRGRPPFPGPSPPHGFGPHHWGGFPFGHSPRPPFHFMQQPPSTDPPAHPPPPHSEFSENTRPYASHCDDESSIKSLSVSSTAHGASTVTTEDFQADAPHESGEAPSIHPHHNHEYAEPTAFPYYCQLNQHYLHHHLHHPPGHHGHHPPGHHGHHPPGHHGHHPPGHHSHHGKIKWKKYLKLMMKGKVPPMWPGMMEPQEPSGDMPNPSRRHRRKSAPDDGGSSTCEFKIACKFCDKIIERDRVGWHQRKECPVLSVHRCGVCERVFRKRHFLIKHIQEHNHFGMANTGAPQANTLAGIDASTLSSLQEKMNASLKLLNVSDSPAHSETGKTAGVAGSQTIVTKLTQDEKQPSGTDSGLASQIQSKGIDKIQINDKENRMHVGCEGGKTDQSHRENFQCMTCRHAFQSVENLTEHLREHINQVLAIQKVREWRNKSSEYFFLGHDEGEDRSEETGSVTTTTSYVDSELTSATGSIIPDHVSSNFSSLETAASRDPKWTKPHKKRSSHRHKGEIMICEFCGDKFAFRKDLHFHMETKHKDSTLQCPVCRKKFSWKKRGKFYERHLNSHYGVKVFKHKCEACGKTFLENSKLRAHMSLHNNELLHKCGVCGKGYANKSSLVRHERKHTGVKPYQCDVCKESFMEKRELLRHSTTHTGVAPFSCGECGQGFTLKTSLMSHMKKKHSKRKEK